MIRRASRGEYLSATMHRSWPFVVAKCAAMGRREVDCSYTYEQQQLARAEGGIRRLLSQLIKANGAATAKMRTSL